MTRTILITTALDPPSEMPHLAIAGEPRRTLATKAAALFWSTLPGISKMVIADSTGTRLLSDEEVELMEQSGLQVEQLATQQDEAQVTARGKGVAEGALIAFALRNSQLLRSEPGFFKVTGKIVCRNFASVRELLDVHQVTRAFWHDSRHGLQPTGWVDMRFYYCTGDYFFEHLAPAYAAADDRAGKIAEQACAPVVAATCTPGVLVRPLLMGLSGGMGTMYPEHSFGDLDRAFPGWYSKQ